MGIRRATVGEIRTLLAIMNDVEPEEVYGSVIFTVVNKGNEPHIHVIVAGLNHAQALIAIDEGLEAF
jgi:hypothetical protein